MARNQTEKHLVQYLHDRDIEVVTGRIPPEHRKRLEKVYLKDESRGAKRLGSVRIRGRRDINIYSILPPRVSLRGFMFKKGRSAAEFGAPSRGQWPPWAVRRLLLYGTFLHELGHLQMVDPKASDWNKRYASELLAEEFANEWRRSLFAKGGLEHPDPVHFPPSPAEIDFIAVWERLDKAQRYQLVTLAIDAPYDERQELDFLGDLTEAQRRFVESALYQNRSQAIQSKK